MPETQDGYLLIADITGYTQYLSESELEHARETLTALLKLLVEHTRPPLIISRLEGDAVISYGLGSHFFTGQTFVETIEDTYTAFRKAIERMVLNNACRCNACANIPHLDLKFFIHYGAFAIQRVGGYTELVGSDVNLIHRLLKNHVEESTGLRAYALWTESAVQALGLEGIRETMVPHCETYDYLGDVNTWVQDMHPIWERKRSLSQIRVPPNRAARQMEVEIGAPPELLWDYLVRPEFRMTLTGADKEEVLSTTGGRVGEGNVYQCYHGDKIIQTTILEWQPFERMVVQTRVPVPIPNTTVVTEYQLVKTGAGTLFTQLDSKPNGPLLGRMLVSTSSGSIAKKEKRQIEAFKQRVEADLSAHAAAGEPEVSRETLREAAAASLAGRAS